MCNFLDQHFRLDILIISTTKQRWKKEDQILNRGTKQEYDQNSICEHSHDKCKTKFNLFPSHRSILINSVGY